MTQFSSMRIDDLNAVSFIQNRVVRFCAAHVLGILERWTKWKLKRQQDPWIYMPIVRQEIAPTPEGKTPTSWHQELLGQFGKDAIRSALAILEQMGVIFRRKNPYNGQDKTYQYMLDIDELNRLRTPPTSEGDMSPMESGYSPTPQRSTLSTTKLERATPKAKNQKRGQEESHSTPAGSNIQTEPISDPKAIAEDRHSAPADRTNFASNLECLKQADLTQFEAPEEDSIEDEFFQWVIAHRISKLPQPPADPEVVAKNWIRKHGKLTVKAFIKWKKALLDRPAAPPPPPTEAECQRSPEQILAQYQQTWQRSPNMRGSIRKMIEKRPEWGIAIGESGPCWKNKEEISCQP